MVRIYADRVSSGSACHITAFSQWANRVRSCSEVWSAGVDISAGPRPTPFQPRLSVKPAPAFR